jgi:hypothetical protein
MLQPVSSVFVQFVQNCGYIYFFCKPLRLLYNLFKCILLFSPYKSSLLLLLWQSFDSEIYSNFMGHIFPYSEYQITSYFKRAKPYPHLSHVFRTHKTATRSYKRIQIPAAYMNYLYFHCNKETECLKQISRAMFWNLIFMFPFIMM